MSRKILLSIAMGDKFADIQRMTAPAAIYKCPIYKEISFPSAQICTIMSIVLVALTLRPWKSGATSYS